jgi:hypothetical protein
LGRAFTAAVFTALCVPAILRFGLFGQRLIQGFRTIPPFFFRQGRLGRRRRHFRRAGAHLVQQGQRRNGQDVVGDDAAGISSPLGGA